MGVGMYLWVCKTPQGQSVTFKTAGSDEAKQKFPSNRLPLFSPPLSAVVFITSSPDLQP